MVEFGYKVGDVDIATVDLCEADLKGPEAEKDEICWPAEEWQEISEEGNKIIFYCNFIRKSLLFSQANSRKKSFNIYFILTFPKKTEARFITPPARQGDCISVGLCDEHHAIPWVKTKILETNKLLRKKITANFILIK